MKNHWSAAVLIVREAALREGVTLRTPDVAGDAPTDWIFWTGERYPRALDDYRPTESVFWLRSLFAYEMEAENPQDALGWLRDAFAANPRPGEGVEVIAVERFVEAKFDE